MPKLEYMFWNIKKQKQEKILSETYKIHNLKYLIFWTNLMKGACEMSFLL